MEINAVDSVSTSRQGIIETDGFADAEWLVAVVREACPRPVQVEVNGLDNRYVATNNELPVDIDERTVDEIVDGIEGVALPGSAFRSGCWAG